MKRSTTEKLNEILLQIDNPAMLADYLQKHAPAGHSVTFHDYLLSWITDHHLMLSDIVEASGIERTYCYHILNGTKQHPSRDKILRLCIACGMDERHTAKALEAAQEAVLYPKNRRDAVILYGIAHQMSIMDLNALLDDFEMKPIE